MGKAKVVRLPGRNHQGVIAKLLSLFPLLGISLALTTCGKGQAPALLDQAAGSPQPPTISDLSNLLMAELARLGKDPSKIVAAAPSGSDNAVFNLSASIQGEAGIELTWTERIIGDYDQNGEVNLTDITPMVLNWGEPVAYDDPALHGGFDRWPTGDPDGAGAANWRLARIDGDGNGEINTSDITPIAMHFHERLDGYRVYRKAPGETQFTMLPPPVPVDADLTLAHPDSPDNTAPVRYSLSDSEATPGGLGDGVYQYYVAPYDSFGESEGAPSGIVHVDIVAGTVNQSPVAQLSISPGFAGAPAEITLDASGSYDVDGTVVAYEWDFDADGVVDWLSTDPLPDESSSGTVDSIIKVSPGVVKATYNQGFAEWFYPDVTVADTEDLWSMPANARLGLSGWIREELPDLDIQGGDYSISEFVEDPNNGQVVAVAWYKPPGSSEYGVGLIHRTGPGVWSGDLAASNADLNWDGVSIPSIRAKHINFAWDSQDKPVFVIEYWEDLPGNHRSRIYSIHKSPADDWVVELRLESFDPAVSKGPGMAKISRAPDGEIAVVVGELIKQFEPPSTPSESRIDVLTWKDGEWTLDLAVWEAPNSERGPSGGFAFDNNGTLFMLLETMEDDPYNLSWLKRNAIGDWVQEQLADGSVIGTHNAMVQPEWLAFTNDNDIVLQLRRMDSTSFPYQYVGYEVMVIGQTSTQVLEFQERVSQSFHHVDLFDQGIAAFSGLYEVDFDGTNDRYSMLYDRFENQGSVHETVYSEVRMPNESTGGINALVTFSDGRAFLAARTRFPEHNNELQEYLLIRVDPRE